MSADALLADSEFEQVQVLRDPEIGLFGFLAIHSTRLGPAFGGIRRMTYRSSALGLADALRLAEHMTLKCAIQGIPGGGGKAVLCWRPDADRAACYRRLGEFVQALGGRFYTGPDVGTEASDLAVVASATGFVTRPGARGPGDLGAATAAGVCAGVRAAARRLGRSDLQGCRVVVTGLGDVGGKLAGLLAAAGAELGVADIRAERAAEVGERLGAAILDPHRAHAQPCEVFAPCALGGVVDAASIGELGARAIAGSANNVLANRAQGVELHRRGIVYAPDFVINSGGLVQGSLFHLEGAVPPPERLQQIGALLDEIFARAARADLSPEQVAESMARDRVAAAPNRIFVPGRAGPRPAIEA